MIDILNKLTFVNCRQLRQNKGSTLFKHAELMSGKRTVSQPTRQQLFFWRGTQFESQRITVAESSCLYSL